MAITKTTILNDITIWPSEATGDSQLNSNHPRIVLTYEDIIDDTEDADLPIKVIREKYLYKFLENGGAETDYSGEDALVKSVCAVIWSE